MQDSTIIGNRNCPGESVSANRSLQFSNSISNDLKRVGFESIRDQILLGWLSAWNGKATNELSLTEKSFNELVRDPYVPSRFGVRKRRLSRYHYSRSTAELIPTASRDFKQSKFVNPLVGGIARKFQPLRKQVRDSELIRGLVHVLLSRIDDSWQEWSINVHQMRVDATNGQAHPAPEGMHQDGHDYIAIVLMNRHNVAGGVNKIYDTKRKPLFRKQLLNRFDCLLLDDRKNYHGVSPIYPEVAGTAYRDTFVIDFNKAAEA